MSAHRDALSQLAPRGLRTVLVLGGARSGKSTFAERVAQECGEPVLYVATATPEDDEMADRIARHRARRPASWHTLEVQRDLATAVAGAGEVRTVLVEDLTLALSNLMQAGTADAAHSADAAEEALVEDVRRLLQLAPNVVLVSNEVGMGVVPPYPVGRAFRDALGRVNQFAASMASEVYVLLAGLPLRLK